MAELTEKQRAENEERATRARPLLATYAAETGVEDVSAVQDLITDLLHAAGLSEAEAWSTVRMALNNYEAEVTGEE